METHTTENQPGTAERDARRGHGGAIATAGVIAFLAVVLLVVPGFVVAGLSRVDSDRIFCANENVLWDEHQYYTGMPARWRAETVMLEPSGWLMRHSQAIRSFYKWQYRIAGGRNVDVDY